MGILVVLFGFAIVVLGFYVLIKGIRINQSVRKYEFENRTGGGSVRFKDFDASLEHQRKQMRSKFVQGLGLAVAIVGTSRSSLAWSCCSEIQSQLVGRRRTGSTLPSGRCHGFGVVVLPSICN